ncbi:cobyrinate a,c-diamide synthase [Ahrensia sp. 13_GOM-1096m]|uniref:cobyrinate a,c-diamide synthase n=1 Tax=Ahrensia sp. 13_GOM-1096m TaxID=1380380 RepID=UPI00047A1398|nr:cobyrinate a,c-diamide synthase [Ahrensia sp. 13_GOM-1096m]
MNGFMIAAPHSGSGKTTVTLGLLRALRTAGVAVAPAKAGPDYIDPAFHAFASGELCFNLDPWAMRDDLIDDLAHKHGENRLLIVEAMMGLFDGAADGTGSAADLAEQLGLPIVFVVDCARMAQSISALVSGYMNYRPSLRFAGIVLNRVGSARHEQMLRAALKPLDVPILGVVMQDADLALPSRHLGLVQAREHESLEGFLNKAGEIMGQSLDLDALTKLDAQLISIARPQLLPPLGQHIAIAVDDAFAFCYPHMVQGWRSAGAEISYFSPLADEGPEREADAIFLPGGYPELYAAQLAATKHFKRALRNAADRKIPIYGECGGYMVLGEAIIDADGKSHDMLGLLPLKTSFETRKRHLGYRKLKPLDGSPWQFDLKGHEFHYSTEIKRGVGEPLFAMRDALGNDLGEAGLRVGSVAGSYCHVIDRAA